MIIQPDRLVLWAGKIEESGLTRVFERMLELTQQDPKKEIFLLVSSPGGSASAGFCFYDTARVLWDGPQLITVGSGNISSAAITVWLAGKHRILTENATLFFHDARRHMGTGAYDVDELGSARQSLGTDRKIYMDILEQASRGKLERNKIAELLRKPRTYTAKQILKMGFADEIIGTPSE